jgi:hypothetical protein
MCSGGYLPGQTKSCYKNCCGINKQGVQACNSSGTWDQCNVTCSSCTVNLNIIEDTSIFLIYPDDVAWGSVNVLVLGAVSLQDVSAVLIRFEDPSNKIPSNASILKVEFCFVVGQVHNGGSVTPTIFQHTNPACQNWSEKQITWNNNRCQTGRELSTFTVSTTSSQRITFCETLNNPALTVLHHSGITIAEKNISGKNFVFYSKEWKEPSFLRVLYNP